MREVRPLKRSSEASQRRSLIKRELSDYYRRHGFDAETPYAVIKKKIRRSRLEPTLTLRALKWWVEQYVKLCVEEEIQNCSDKLKTEYLKKTVGKVRYEPFIDPSVWFPSASNN